MSKKKWLAFIAIFIVTNVITFKLSPYIVQVTDYVDLINLEGDLPEVQQKYQDEYFEVKEEKRIYIGVAIPEDLISGNEQKDYEMAVNLLFYKDENSFRYLKIEKRFGHHTYTFHPMIKK